MAINEVSVAILNPFPTAIFSSFWPKSDNFRILGVLEAARDKTGETIGIKVT